MTIESQVNDMNTVIGGVKDGQGHLVSLGHTQAEACAASLTKTGGCQ